MKQSAYRFLIGFFNKELNGKCLTLLKKILSKEQIDVLFNEEISFSKRIVDLFLSIDKNFQKGKILILKLTLLSFKKII